MIYFPYPFSFVALRNLRKQRLFVSEKIVFMCKALASFVVRTQSSLSFCPLGLLCINLDMSLAFLQNCREGLLDIIKASDNDQPSSVLEKCFTALVSSLPFISGCCGVSLWQLSFGVFPKHENWLHD